MQRGFTPGPIDSPAGRLATANTGFALTLCNQLADSLPGQNLFFSPGSISVAMAMTYLGARGNTATEIKKTMNFEDIDEAELHQSFSDILAVFQKSEEQGTIKLHMANRLFAEKSFDFVAKYVEDTKKLYAAELAKVDYISNSDGVRSEINKWVSDKTADRIKDIIPAGVLNNLTRLVLVNAVYFKGDWKLKFDPKKTEPADFTLLDGSTVPVQMMFQKEKFAFGVNQALHTQAIELPYAGGSMSLIILLPEPGHYKTFTDNVKTDDVINVEKSFRMMAGRDVHVWLPRFKVESSFGLSDTLSALGMKDLFSESDADLTGIDQTRSLFVSAVLHKAFLEVNEEGSEAAAATAVVMQMRMMPKVFHFKADRPFVFFIRENTTRSVLFMGRLMKPEA